MTDIAIFGAGGMGREVACVIERINAQSYSPIWKMVGFFDDGLVCGTKNEFGEVLGGVDALNQYTRPLAVVIAVGDPLILQRIHGSIKSPYVSYPNIIDPTTVYWHRNSLQMGVGNIFCPHCDVSCHVEIGNFNIFNGNISLRHDVKVGDYNALMPGVRLSGGVQVGDLNFFGLNASVAQYHVVGTRARIGAGAIVMNDIADAGLYVGIPARIKG